MKEYRENNRRSTYFNHHSAISESIGALSWIAIRPAPASFVFEMSEIHTKILLLENCNTQKVYM